MIGKWFRHEGGLDPFEGGDLPDDYPEGHDVVGHRQRIGVTKVNFVLSGSGFVVAELYRDTHLLQDVDGVATEVGARSQGGVVEVATVVQRHRGFPRMMLIVKQVELNLWVNIEGKTHFCGTTHRPLEDVTRISCRGGSVRIGDIAEHPGRAGARTPWQNLEGGRIGVGHHICLVDAGIPLDS